MKTLTLFLSILFAFQGIAQSTCDSLEIVHVNVDAFFNNQLNITLQNNNTQEIFDYPGFRVFDQDNNLIGEEEVFFFGLSGESTHSITFDTTAFSFSEGQEYQIKLELWTGFYDTLACVFDLNTILVPSLLECIPVSITFFEFSSTQVSYDWLLTDYWGNIIQEETLVFSDDVNMITRNVCLDQSCFYLNASSALDPELSALYINVIADVNYGFISSPLLNMSNDSTMLFSIWSDCSLINSQESIDIESFDIFPNPATESLNIQSNSFSSSNYKIFDSNGKLVSFGSSNSPAFQLSIAELENGIYILALDSENQAIRKKFIKN